MRICTTAKEIETALWHERHSRRSIGFLPTMGALHSGHLSLLHTAQRYTAVSVCSIFVNPTQFNDLDDLAKYPRPIEQDIQLLQDHGCDYLLLPDVQEVYPSNWQTAKIDIQHLASQMEGAHRPGHFEGMVQVVERLLYMVQPDELIMGQKDFQQHSIIAFVLEHLSLPVRLRIVPTEREPDGLAISSRNRLLEPHMRQVAPVLYQALLFARKQLALRPINDIIAQATQMITDAGLSPEYFEIVDSVTLQSVDFYQKHQSLTACTAAWAGRVRLIDNLPLQQLQSQQS